MASISKSKTSINEFVNSNIKSVSSNSKKNFLAKNYTVNEEVDEYGKMYYGRMLHDKGYGLDYNISTDVDNMLPGIDVSSAPGIQGVGTVLMGVSSLENSYHRALVEGYDNKTAAVYGIVSGSSEAIMERILGDLPNVGSSADFGSFLAGKERFEENVQEIADQGIFRSSILDEDVDISKMLKDTGVNGLYEMATAGIMQTPGTVNNALLSKNILNSDTILD